MSPILHHSRVYILARILKTTQLFICFCFIFFDRYTAWALHRVGIVFQWETYILIETVEQDK